MSEDLFDTDDSQTDMETIHIDGTDQPVHDGTTPQDLKTERQEVTDEGEFTYRDTDGKLRTIPDDDPILEYIDPGESVNVQPVQGDIFGATPGYSTV